MKVLAIVRTLNETLNIRRFLDSYLEIANKVLIADGGSTDDTLEIAATYSSLVEVQSFHERVERNKLWRNPEGRHINFLVDWATESGADWVILDDCDSIPNEHLRLNARSILQSTDADVVKSRRIYLWGADKWFPDLSGTFDPKRGDWTCLWAWKPSPSVRWVEGDGWSINLEDPHLENRSVLRLEFPHALLHYFCSTPEETERKLNFYRGSGQVENMLHPLDGCGPLEPFPDWAKP